MPGERAWAEVAHALDDGIYRRAQFYRLAEGRWLRTGLQREYFGPGLFIRLTEKYGRIAVAQVPRSAIDS